MKRFTLSILFVLITYITYGQFTCDRIERLPVVYKQGNSRTFTYSEQDEHGYIHQKTFQVDSLKLYWDSDTLKAVAMRSKGEAAYGMLPSRIIAKNKNGIIFFPGEGMEYFVRIIYDNPSYDMSSPNWDAIWITSLEFVSNRDGRTFLTYWFKQDGIKNKY